MKYKYLYQTRNNENREGEITAANRAEAYAALRKQGIRPYRVIGDDPSPWRRRGAFAALAAAIALVVASSVSAIAFRGRSAAHAPSHRAQLVGDAQFIARGVAEAWEGVFQTKLDTYLAAYAQPGWALEPQLPSIDELEGFGRELETPLVRDKDERGEIRQLRNIVAGMRAEMADYLAGGGTVADYVNFLAERQEQECELREKAREALARAPESMKRTAWRNLNVRLSGMGIAPLPDFDAAPINP